jgi:glycosyltransferase involved in cell wall biosynthesis
MTKILMMASSTGVGLTYHYSRPSMGLKKNGHDVVVLSGPKEQLKGLFTHLREAGIECFTNDHIDGGIVHDIYGCKKSVEKIIKERNIDIIHTQGATQTLGAYLATRSLRYNNRPSIVTNIHYIPRGALKKLEQAVMVAILNKCSNIILPVSNYTKMSLIKNGLNIKKTVTVHNSIDLNEFDNAIQGSRKDSVIKENDGPAIVYIANLTPVKGQEYYLRAAAQVLKNHRALFYVVGSGPRRQYLEELAHRLRIEKNVVFTGRIQWPEIYPFLSNVADICVSSSVSENFPFYILECMAAGKPIVATNVGGVHEAVIDGVNGFLVPPKDPTSLAQAIQALINDPGRAREMGSMGRRLVEQKYSMDVTTKKLNDVYEAVLQKLGN